MIYLARLMLRNKYGKICKKEKKSSTNSVNSKSPLLTYFFSFLEKLWLLYLGTPIPNLNTHYSSIAFQNADSWDKP